ncbi:MAG TPA: cytochrome c [Thermoanaerobaculia bacterium]|nr:cytochrome c [Thermoanaerobaculia bacterium]
MRRALLLLLLVGCSRQTPYSLIGNAARGKTKVQQYGCSACHVVPHVEGSGAVGPPLTRMASRLYIAGEFPNVPQYMVRWIENPQGMKPHDAMPNLSVSERDARDIAAYLYTLR